MLSKYFSGFQILFIFPPHTPDLWLQTEGIAGEQGRNAETEEAPGAVFDQTESTEASASPSRPAGETRQEGRRGQPGAWLSLQAETDHRLSPPPEIHQAGLQQTSGSTGALR